MCSQFQRIYGTAYGVSFLNPSSHEHGWATAHIQGHRVIATRGGCLQYADLLWAHLPDYCPLGPRCGTWAMAGLAPARTSVISSIQVHTPHAHSNLKRMLPCCAELRHHQLQMPQNRSLSSEGIPTAVGIPIQLLVTLFNNRFASAHMWSLLPWNYMVDLFLVVGLATSCPVRFHLLFSNEFTGLLHLLLIYGIRQFSLCSPHDYVSAVAACCGMTAVSSSHCSVKLASQLHPLLLPHRHAAHAYYLPASRAAGLVCRAAHACCIRCSCTDALTHRYTQPRSASR